MEGCSVVYFAGYLGKKCVDHFKCTACQKSLLDDTSVSDDNNVFLFYKNYNINNPISLKKPWELISRYTLISMKEFSRQFERNISRRHLHLHINNQISSAIRHHLPEWFDCVESECNEHRKYMADLLIRILIYKQCKSLSVNFKAHGEKRPRKLSIVQSQ